MNVVIEIHYITNGVKNLQSSTFPLRGKSPEHVALEFWRQIQKEMPYDCQLEKVIIAGGENITEKVLELENQDTLKQFYATDDLPF